MLGISKDSCKTIADNGLWEHHDLCMVDSDTFGQRVEFLVSRSGLNKREFAKAIGIGPDMLSRWIANDVETPRLTNLREIARLFKYPMGPMLDFLRDGIPLPEPPNAPQASHHSRPANWPAGKIPAVGHVPGNGNSQGISDFTQYGSWPESFVDQGDVAGPNSISAFVKGDSMEPTLRDGIQVIADPDAGLADGCVVVVQFTQARDETNTVKRYFDLGNGRIKLIADNAARHKPMEVNREDIAWIGRCVERRERM